MKEIRQAIENAIDDVNDLLPPAGRLDKSDDTPLAAKGALDSMNFINFVAALEDELYERFDLDVSLVEKAEGEEGASPFRDVGSLKEYLARLVQSRRNGSGGV